VYWSGVYPPDFEKYFSGIIGSNLSGFFPFVHDNGEKPVEAIGVGKNTRFQIFIK